MQVEDENIRDMKKTERQLVVFELAGEKFGVDINKVKEIIRWEEVTRIPNTPPYIKGVINLRGNIIVVNDLAMKLGLPSKKVDDNTRILVVEVGDNTVGMIVDSATEVIRLESDRIRKTPPIITGSIDRNFIEGVGLLDEKRLLTLLDLSKVLESTDYVRIAETQEAAKKLIERKTEENLAVDTTNNKPCSSEKSTVSTSPEKSSS